VTDAGVENFTAFLPAELDDLEELARQRGLVQFVPALAEAQFAALARAKSPSRSP
jgi:hypothetical protein